MNVTNNATFIRALITVLITVIIANQAVVTQSEQLTYIALTMTITSAIMLGLSVVSEMKTN